MREFNIDSKLPKQNEKSPEIDLKDYDKKKIALMLYSHILYTNKLKKHTKKQLSHINYFSKIGIALSAEKNIKKIFKLVVAEAMSLTNADAGTLYTVENELKLKFEVLYNLSLKQKKKGIHSTIKLEGVPLYIEHKPNLKNVSSYVFHKTHTININNVYTNNIFDFIEAKKYDKITGYFSKSMLVVPMKNHENDIIGILQLINAKKQGSNDIISFQKKHENIIESLASLAAVALNNAQLIKNIKNLFYSFIKSIATAIDEKSPYTGGHIRRVVFLSSLIASEINKTNEKPFNKIQFDNDKLEELKIASWLHDFGKIVTPEHIIDKSKKLQTIFDRIKLIKTRFKLIEKSFENLFLKDKINILLNQNNTSKSKLNEIDNKIIQAKKELKNDIAFIEKCNNSNYMGKDSIKKIKSYGLKTFSHNNKLYPYLTENEIENLCIEKGTLTAKERKIIENHADLTYKITKELPFPRHLKSVPIYAKSHHEFLDGSGYPSKYSKDTIPIQTRIITIADIFEALTAKDRPYKKPMSLSKALEILISLKKNKKIDPDICDLFIKKKLYYKYALKEMNEKQIDEQFFNKT